VYPGVETPELPDVVDAVDADDVVEGLLCLSCGFFSESARLHSAKTDETHFGGFGTTRMACFPVFTIFVYTRRT
jgi:hypothetical protein